MGFFKRAVASLGLVALLTVSGAALADENDDIVVTSDETVSDVLVSDEAVSDEAVGDTTGDTTVDDIDGDADSDTDNQDNEGDVSESDECKLGSFDALAVSIDGEDVISEPIGETDNVTARRELLEQFVQLEAEGSGVSYLEFMDLFDAGARKDIEEKGLFADFHKAHKVVVTYQYGGRNNPPEGCVSGISIAFYEFTVLFPFTSENPPALYQMPIYFDDIELESYVLLPEDDSDPNFERLVALNGKEMSVDEFLTVMDELGAYTGDFLKVGEAYGKHKVTFADYDDAWSVVTVVYPERGNGGQVTPKPPTPPQQPKPPATNFQGGSSQAGNAPIVTAYDMSYRQFRGSTGSTLSSVGSSPAIGGLPTASMELISTDSLASGNDDVAEDQPDVQDPAPTLPVTSGNGAKKSGSDAALSAGDDTISARAAAFAVIACLGFGVVAASSVVSVRRFMKANS